jgi:hypothetical protein
VNYIVIMAKAKKSTSREQAFAPKKRISFGKTPQNKGHFP